MKPYKQSEKLARSFLAGLLALFLGLVALLVAAVVYDAFAFITFSVAFRCLMVASMIFGGICIIGELANKFLKLG